MKGSGFLASGSYGCVFDRPLLCEKNTNRNGAVYKGTVGKVFKHHEAAVEESDIQQIIEQIDPLGEFTIEKLRYCDVGAVVPSDGVDDCDLHIPMEKAAQIIYKNGGVDLHTVMTRDKASTREYIKIFRKLRPVLVGLKRLNEQGYHHLDIKPENLLWNGKKISVVDFGLMRLSEDVFSKYEQGRLYFDYLYYPPEFKFWVYCQKTPRVTGFKTFLRKYEKNLYAMHMTKNYELFKGISAEQQVSAFFNQFVTNTKGFKSTLNKREFKKFIGLTDIFSLGMTLLIMYVYMVTNETATTVAIKDFINKLVALNPYERYSWDNTIKYYDYVMSIIGPKHKASKKN